jgi:small subunit ribosomal protein S17
VIAMRQYRNDRKNAKIGLVVQAKVSKTLKVRVQNDKYVSKYNKFLSYHKSFAVHDEENFGRVGDTVRIVPCIRKSKTKFFLLKDVIKRLGSSEVDAPPIHKPKTPEYDALKLGVEARPTVKNIILNESLNN